MRKELKSTDPIFILLCFLFGAVHLTRACISSSKRMGVGRGLREGACFRTGEGKIGGQSGLRCHLESGAQAAQSSLPVPVFLLMCHFHHFDAVRVTCTCGLRRRGHGPGLGCELSSACPEWAAEGCTSQHRAMHLPSFVSWEPEPDTCPFPRTRGKPVTQHRRCGQSCG